ADAAAEPRAGAWPRIRRCGRARRRARRRADRRGGVMTRTKTFPMPRYVVREIEGRLASGGGHHATGGLTVSVHDVWNGYRTLALFRTEDYDGARPRELRFLLARAQARAFAETIEE